MTQAACERTEHDRAYIRNMSLRHDLAILLLTIIMGIRKVVRVVRTSRADAKLNKARVR
jgi:lipopolysaccharide/colanic/teichoic acid biosynthesis glycosyltransferase